MFKNTNNQRNTHFWALQLICYLCCVRNVLGAPVRFVIGWDPVFGPLHTLINVVANQIVGFLWRSPLDEDRGVCLPGSNHLTWSRWNTWKQKCTLNPKNDNRHNKPIGVVYVYLFPNLLILCNTKGMDRERPLSSWVSIGPVASDGWLFP